MDSATDTSTLGASADLAISKTDNQASHTPGTPIDYVIVVENFGPSVVSDARGYRHVSGTAAELQLDQRGQRRREPAIPAPVAISTTPSTCQSAPA